MEICTIIEARLDIDILTSLISTDYIIYMILFSNKKRPSEIRGLISQELGWLKIPSSLESKYQQDRVTVCSTLSNSNEHRNQQL